VAAGVEAWVLQSHPAKVFTLAEYTPGRIASGGSDNDIRLWDLGTRRLLGQLQGHTGSVASLAIDRGRLVSGSFDTTVRIWSREEIQREESRPFISGQAAQ